MIYLILLLGFVLRLVHLNQSLWLDEAIEVLAVKNNSYWELVTKYSVGDFHPPLYHLVLKFWTGLAGYNEIAARLPSVAAGVATVYFVYLLGKKLWNQKVGLAAAVFMATSPLAVYYSQEARMYSLAAFTITAAIYFFIAKKPWPFALFLLIALSTDYLPWLMLPIFWRYWFLGFFLLPWAPLILQQLSTGLTTANLAPGWAKVVGGFDFKAIPLTLAKFIIGRITLENKLLYAGVMLPISAVYIWTISQVKNRLLWAWLLVPLILGFLLSTKIPVFSYFRFLFVLPAFVLLLARGAEKNKVAQILIVVVSVASLAIFNLYPKFQREDWRSAVEYMTTKDSLVVMPSLAQVSPINYYGPQLIVMDTKNIRIQNVSTIFLLRYVQEIFDPQDLERKTIEQTGFKRVEEKGFNGVLVWKYQL